MNTKMHRTHDILKNAFETRAQKEGFGSWWTKGHNNTAAPPPKGQTAKHRWPMPFTSPPNEKRQCDSMTSGAPAVGGWPPTTH